LRALPRKGIVEELGEATRFYSIDTSALIDLKRLYPRVTFPGLWERIEVMVGDGRLIAAAEVLAELEQKDDDLVHWARGQTRLFVPWSSELVEAAQDVIRRFPGICDPNKWAVVTTERSIQGVRIPGVCNAVGLECLDLRNFFEYEGWVLH